MAVIKAIAKVYALLRQEGKDAVVEKIFSVISKRYIPSDILNKYRFVVENTVSKQCLAADTDDGRTVNWVIPDVTKPGAGGHTTIFRCIAFLQKHGYQNRIYFFNELGMDTRYMVGDTYHKYYEQVSGIKQIYSVHCDPILSAQAVVATSWQTAYAVRRINNCGKKLYFVQDFEPSFFPSGSAYAMAENTYCWGFVGIAASPWLKMVLEDRYQMKSYAFGFSYDKEIYYPRKAERQQQRVLLYAQPSKERRAFDVAILALYMLKQTHAQIEIVFVGEDVGSKYKIPFAYENKGVLQPKQLADEYASSDLCIVFSCSNVSLLPLEIMACRSVVFSNTGEHVRWLLNENVAIMEELDPQKICKKIESCLSQPNKMEEIREKGYQFATKTSWEEEYKKVLECLNEEIQ